MLQGCELKVNEYGDSYSKHVTHVYAQNQYCNEWNNKRITTLQGDKYECVAFDSEKDHCTELTTKRFHLNLKRQEISGRCCTLKWAKSYSYNNH